MEKSHVTVVSVDLDDNEGPNRPAAKHAAESNASSTVSLSMDGMGLTPKERLEKVEQARTNLNPFVNNTPPWSRKIVWQTILVSIFILPLRLALFCPSIAIAWILDAVANIGHYVDDEPMANWRVRLVNWSSYFWRAWLFSLSFQTIEIKGTPAPRDKAPICVVNHISFIDIFIMYACKRFMFMAKKEVTKIPFGRDIIRAGQTIIVDRANKESANVAKEIICRRARHTVDKEANPNQPEWPTMVIFPESTCTNGTALITFKHGAFMPGVPVQPITIKYHFKTADPCKVYGGGPGIGQILLRMLTSVHNSVTVNFMDVYKPDIYERRDPHLFAENVRVAMAKSLKVSITNHSYADVQLLIQAQRMNIRKRSRKHINMEMNTLSDVLNAKCSPSELKYFMNAFHEEASKTGELNRDQLFKVLKMPRNPVTERIFLLFDINSDGTLQFKEFMAGICLLYFSKDKGTLGEIVSKGKNEETGLLYFDMSDMLNVQNMKSFAFTRTKKKFPMSMRKSAVDSILTKSEGLSSMQSVSLSSARDESDDLTPSDRPLSPISPRTPSEEGSPYDADRRDSQSDFKVWWTPEELTKYIMTHASDFDWLVNPNSRGGSSEFS